MRGSKCEVDARSCSRLQGAGMRGNRRHVDQEPLLEPRSWAKLLCKVVEDSRSQLQAAFAVL